MPFTHRGKYVRIGRRGTLRDVFVDGSGMGIFMPLSEYRGRDIQPPLADLPRRQVPSRLSNGWRQVRSWFVPAAKRQAPAKAAT